MIRRALVLIALALVAPALATGHFAAPARADDALPAPTGRVVLTVTGNVTRANAGGAAAFDLAMLEALPRHAIVTATPWTGERPVTFEGPLLRDVLAAAGATGTTLNAVALNDYKSTLPVADVVAYDVIVATRRDGAAMSVREKGPLWIIYPLTDRPALDTRETHMKMAWQLKAIDVE